MPIVCKTSLRDVYLIKPEVHIDKRGEYVMTYHENFYSQFVDPIHFVEQDISTSRHGVLRGIHYSPNSWKLNECLYGSIYYVVVNCDEKDDEFGKWEAFTLDDHLYRQLFKHPRYGSGFYVMSDYAVFHYMQSEYYDDKNPNQATFLWNDKRFNIKWPCKHPILSERDKLGHYDQNIGLDRHR